MEGVAYLKPWKTVFIRRSLGTLVYLILALPIAYLAAALGRML